jgi:hypothetical protein
MAPSVPLGHCYCGCGRPFGICHCDCGQPTKPATRTRPEFGHVKGRPTLYLKGHHRHKTPAESYRPGDTVKHRDNPWPWRIPLRRTDGTVRAFALVDEEDYERINAYRWSLATVGYAVRNLPYVDGKPTGVVYMHREILSLGPGDRLEGDHRHGDRLDNRRAKLRPLPKPGNRQNQPSKPGSTSRYRGVDWFKPRGKWRARVQVDGKSHHIGYFDDEGEAGARAEEIRLQLQPYAVRGR